MKVRASRQTKEGFTLVGVLVFCFLLIPVCATLAQSSRDLAHGVREDLDAFRRQFLAQGLAEMIAARVGSDGSLLGRLSGTPVRCHLGRDELTVLVRDHDGKVDLNNADSELLIAGFEAGGANRREARLLQQYVEASRSNGVQPREIADMARKISLKHAPFEHVEEVQDAVAALGLPSIDADAFFTINRGTGNIEEVTAVQSLRAKFSTLTNQGVVFRDNGSFDYLDVVVGFRGPSRGRDITVSKTYRKISPLGDVIEIEGRLVAPVTIGSVEPSQSACSTLLSLETEERV